MRALIFLFPAAGAIMAYVGVKLSGVMNTQNKALQKTPPVPELVEKQNAWFNWQIADRATDMLERVLDSDKDLPFLTSGQRNEAKEIVKQFNDRYRSPGTPTDKT